MRRPQDPAYRRGAELTRGRTARLAAIATGLLLLLVLFARALDSPLGIPLAALTGVVATLLLGRRPAPRSGADAPIRLPETTPEDSIRDSVQELQRQTERVRAWCAAASVVLWQSDGERLRPVTAAGRTLPNPLPVSGDALSWVAREGVPLWIEPTPPWSEPGREVAAARVWAGDDVAWIITYEFAPGTPRAPHETLAAHAGIVRVLLEVLAAQHDAAAGQKRLESLLGLLRRIPVEIELAAFGRELLQAAQTLTGATGGCLATWDGESGEVVAVAGGDGGPAVGARFAPPDSELGLAVRAGTAIVREGGQWRPGRTQLANAQDEWLARPRSLAAIPLSTPSGIVGAVALWSSRSPRLPAAALELFGAVLPYAALHLDHALEYGRLRDRADRDALTGLRNRRAFEAAFLTERLRFERYARPMALLMIDLDHFKSINDEYGHEAGDAVLCAVARVIEGAIRDVDIPARFGGEEFMVLLPETTLEPASEVAERVRGAVERAEISAASRRLQVRVSVGVSACPDRVRTPQALLGSADAALYEAKRAGRNRVAVAATV